MEGLGVIRSNKLKQSVGGLSRHDADTTIAERAVGGPAVLKQKDVLNPIPVEIRSSHLNELVSHAFRLGDLQEILT